MGYLYESKNYLKLSLDELRFELYCLSDDTKIVIVGPKLTKKLRVTFKNLS